MSHFPEMHITLLRLHFQLARGLALAAKARDNAFRFGDRN